jgi:hypothetical protein
LFSVAREMHTLNEDAGTQNKVNRSMDILVKAIRSGLLQRAGASASLTR